jgi:hypothetical protein
MQTAHDRLLLAFLTFVIIPPARKRGRDRRRIRVRPRFLSFSLSLLLLSTHQRSACAMITP